MSKIDIPVARLKFALIAIEVKRTVNRSGDDRYRVEVSLWTGDSGPEWWEQTIYLYHEDRCVLEFKVTLECVSVDIMVSWFAFVPSRQCAVMMGVGPLVQEEANISTFLRRYFENGTWWEE